MRRATNLKPEEVSNRYPGRNRESLSVSLSPWRRKQQNIDQQEKRGEEMESEICGALDQHIFNNILQKKKSQKIVLPSKAALPLGIAFLLILTVA